MKVDDFEQHLTEAGVAVGRLTVGEQTYVHLKGITIGGGTHAGEQCEVAILRTAEAPWVPQTAVHVRPHLVQMGQRSSTTAGST